MFIDMHLQWCFGAGASRETTRTSEGYEEAAARGSAHERHARVPGLRGQPFAHPRLLTQRLGSCYLIKYSPLVHKVRSKTIKRLTFSLLRIILVEQRSSAHLPDFF